MNIGMKARKEYQEQLQRRLEDWYVEIEKLQAAAGRMKAEATQEVTPLLETIRSQQAALSSRLQRLAQAGDEHWEQLRTGVDTAAAELQRAIERVKHKTRQAADVPLGWAEGMAERREADSEGWVEGLGRRGKGSQGWSEGMGKRQKDSAGWAEGYRD